MNTPLPADQRREFSRVQAPITASIMMNGVPVQAPVLDLSLNGISLSVGLALDVGALCTVELRRDPTRHKPWVTAHGAVVRVAADMTAIRFTELVGLDSLNALRTLLMYHAADSDALMAEFDAHWGLLPKRFQTLATLPGE